MGSEPERPGTQHRRTRHEGTSRTCRIAISVTGTEQEELQQAARAEALTLSAYVADNGTASIPCLLDPEPDGEDERRFRIINALAGRWGFTRDGGLSRCWAEIAA